MSLQIEARQWEADDFLDPEQSTDEALWSASTNDLGKVLSRPAYLGAAMSNRGCTEVWPKSSWVAKMPRFVNTVTTGIPVALTKFLGRPCNSIVYNTKSLADKNFWATPLYLTKETPSF